MTQVQRRVVEAVVVALATVGSLVARAQDETRKGEWRSSGGDSAYTRYSPLNQITRDNVKNLRILWRRPALDSRVRQQFPTLRTNNYLRSTPTMIGGVLYAPDSAGLLEAFDATTGETVWRQEPPSDMASETSASSTRGVDYWKGGSDQRLFTVRGAYLYALDLRGRALTAFNLNTGTQVWMAANGDGPRYHPLLKDLNLPPLGVPNRPAPLLTKTLLFLGEGSNAVSGTPQKDWAWGKQFRAYDKATGKVIWGTELPSGTTAGPMTYLLKGKQYIVVAVGARDHPPEYVALALP